MEASPMNLSMVFDAVDFIRNRGVIVELPTIDFAPEMNAESQIYGRKMQLCRSSLISPCHQN
jgi:hypothetical protein